MKNTLDNFDYADLSHGEIIAIMRFALTQAKDGHDDVNVNTAFFDEIITRMTSLKGELDDANDKIDGLERKLAELERAKDIDGEDVTAPTVMAKKMKLDRFLRELESDAMGIGGDAGARIIAAVGLIEDIRFNGDLGHSALEAIEIAIDDDYFDFDEVKVREESCKRREEVHEAPSPRIPPPFPHPFCG